MAPALSLKLKVKYNRHRNGNLVELFAEHRTYQQVAEEATLKSVQKLIENAEEQLKMKINVGHHDQLIPHSYCMEVTRTKELHGLPPDVQVAQELEKALLS